MKKKRTVTNTKVIKWCIMCGYNSQGHRFFLFSFQFHLVVVDDLDDVEDVGDVEGVVDDHCGVFFFFLLQSNTSSTELLCR